MDPSSSSRLHGEREVVMFECMSEAPSGRTVKFKILPRVLDHIGLAMYSSVPKAISELIANSYDANAAEVFVDLHEKDGRLCEIIITDTGTGMTPETLETAYLALGYNKRHGATSSGRRPIGNKGIGKLAGLGIAKSMEVVSVSGGRKTTVLISREHFEDKNVTLSDIEFPISVTDAGTEKPGTRVRLFDLLEHAHTVEVAALRGFLTAEFGLTTGFSIYVNKQKLSPSDIDGEERIIKDDIADLGTVTARVKIATRVKDVVRPGLIVYVRGRAIEGPTLYDINTPSHHFRVANRIVGEVNADFLDPDEPKDLLDTYIISTSRDGFNKSNPKYIKFKAWAEKQLAAISRELEKQQAKERIDAIEKNPTVQRALKELPAELRARFEESIHSLIPRLNNLGDADANNIIEFIARLAETESMRKILERIKEAEQSDLEQLAKLLDEWGIYEITSLSTLIKSRLEVITSLETLINNIATKEFPELHKVLEKNLWILDDNYRYYSSNQQMRSIVDAAVMKQYAGKEQLRPDFVCKSLLEKHVVVEIKRPAHVMSYDDVSQLLGYANIIKRQFPQSEILQCFLIGREFDPTLATREPVIHGSVVVTSRSFGEVVEGAKRRYEEILKIFEEEELA
jgi:hypothetical protein